MKKIEKKKEEGSIKYPISRGSTIAYLWNFQKHNVVDGCSISNNESIEKTPKAETKNGGGNIKSAMVVHIPCKS